MATTVLGNLVFQISADMKGIQSQLRTLEGNFQSSVGKIERIAGNAKNVLSSAFGITLGIGGVTAAATALLNLARSAANFADEIGKASQRAGTTTEFLSAMKHGADLADVSFEELTNGVTRFNRVVSDATHGLATAERPFQTLGIAIKDSNGILKTNEVLIGEIASAFQKLPDGIQKSAIAQELFGRSGARLIPLLNGGTEGIRTFTEEARKMGLIVSTDAAKAAEQFNDNMTRLGKSAEGLKLKIGNDLIPVIVRLLDLFGQLAGVKLEGMDTRVLEASLERMDKVISIAQQRLARLGDSVNPIIERERALLRLQLEGLRGDRSDLAEQLNRLKAPQPSGDKGTGTLPALVDSKGIKKSESDVRSFFDGLRKQLDTTRDKISESLFGDDAALGAQLDRTFATFKETFAREFPKLKLPADLDERFQTFRAQIISTNQELRATTFELERLNERARMDSIDSSAWLSFPDDVQKLIVEPLEAAAKAWEAMRLAQLGAALDQDSAEFLTANEGVAQELDRQAREAMAPLTEIADGLERSWERALQAVLISTEDWGDRMTQLGKDIGFSFLAELQKQFVLNPLMDLLFGQRDQGGSRAGGFIGFLGGAIGGLLTGKQHGGPVFGQRPYLVGEAGPELFVPASAGNIIPNYNFMPASVGVPGGSGGVTIVQNNNIDARGAERGAARDIERALARNKREAVSEAVAAVSSERARSNNFARRFS